MNNQWRNIISFLIIAAIVLGVMIKGLPERIVEPENPLKQEITTLKTDIATESGSLQESMEDTENEDPEESDQENEEENEEEEEEKKEEKNVEDQKEDSETEGDTPEEDQEILEDKTPEEDPEKDQNGINGSGENGNKNENHPDKDENGDLPTEGGDETIENPGTGERPGENEHGLVTDLYDRIILFSELDNDTLNFFAYYSDATVDSNVKVNYKHKGESGNGTWLTKKGDHDYSTKLKLGQNYITIFYSDEAGERHWTRITISYQADKANEKEPTKGVNPPIIKTNLDDWSEDIRIFEFTFTVDARKYDGTRIYSNRIQVWLDGELVTDPTGSGIYEYVLQFGRPVEGDISHHTVSVLAWDDEGNSRFVKYQVRHKTNDEGVAIGTVTIEIDVTTLGLGIIDEGVVEVNSGDTAATAVIRMLSEYGYSYKNSGSLERDFYLASISRADAFRGAAIEERLKKLVERDGITLTGNSGRDQLGEFDYTRGSGWMYFINGDYCPGKSMSSYHLNGGEKISLRFTLAFGKDVGSSFRDGNTSLSSYCAKWVNGTILEYEHNYKETERVEATKDADGYILYVCEKCKEEKKEPLIYEGPEEPEGGNETEEGETGDGNETEGGETGDGNETEGGEETGGGSETEGGEETGGGNETEGGEDAGGGNETEGGEDAGGGNETENGGETEDGEQDEI